MRIAAFRYIGEDLRVSKHSILRIPYGIADSKDFIAYIVGPQGIIQCLNLQDGEIVARTDFPGFPLTIDRGTLVGWMRVPEQSGAIRLFAAIRQGSVLELKWKEEIQLPDWVEVDSPNSDGFTIDAAVENGMVVVTWEAHSRYRGAAPPPPHVEEAETHDMRGTASLDSETGTIVDREQVQMAPAPTPTLPELPPRRQILPYRSNTSWETRMWRVGSSYVCLAREVGGPGILLVRYSQGADGPVEIRLTDHPSVEAAVTPDGSTIFIHEIGGDEPTWHAFAADTGEQIASIPFDPGTQGVALVSDLVLYLVVEDLGMTRRRWLRCRNLHTSEAMWSHLLAKEEKRAPPRLRQ